MNRSNPIFQFAATLVGIIAIFGVLAYLLPYRLYKSTERKAALIAEARTRVKFLEEVTLRAKANEANLGTKADAMDAIRAVFFDPKNPLGLIQALEDIAKNTNVELDIDLADFAKMPSSFRLSVRGDVGSLLVFLRMLENAPIFLTVETMTLDLVSGEASDKERQQAGMVVLVSNIAPK